MTALPEGPWTVEPSANSHLFDARIMAGGACIAFAEGEELYDDDGEVVGIEPSPATRAMAAAYELLKAAEEFLAFFENNDDDLAIGEEIRLQDNLRKAIAKARGGAA
jgi:hypothetical protein